MSDHNERECKKCGSYLHHEDDCNAGEDNVKPDKMQEFEKYESLTKVIDWFANHVNMPVKEWGILLREINTALHLNNDVDKMSAPFPPVQAPAIDRGMKWVKCKDRMPTLAKRYVVKRAYSHMDDITSAEFTGRVFTNYDGYKVVEWLDESQTPPSAEVQGKEVEELAKEYIKQLTISSASVDPRRDRDRHLGFIAGYAASKSNQGGISQSQFEGMKKDMGMALEREFILEGEVERLKGIIKSLSNIKYDYDHDGGHDPTYG